jgi:hypothetical protein
MVAEIREGRLAELDATEKRWPEDDASENFTHHFGLAQSSEKIAEKLR